MKENKIENQTSEGPSIHIICNITPDQKLRVYIQDTCSLLYLT